MGDLTFLMGLDGGSNAFYGLAKKFFTAAAASVFDPPAAGQTLEGVLKHLATLKTEQRVINLVSHANGFAAMECPVTLADQRAGRRTMTVDDLNDAVTNKSLAPPSPTVITAKTRVVIYGCDVGRSMRFLTLLSTLLGNPGELFAPKRMSVFQLVGTNVVYRQAQTWSVVRKEPLIPAGSSAPKQGWPKFRDTYVDEAVDKFAMAAITTDSLAAENLKRKLTGVASNATDKHGPAFFVEEGIDIFPVGTQTAAQAAASIAPRSNGDPVTTKPGSADQVDDTTVVTTVSGADAYAAKPDKSVFAITIVVLAKMLDAPVVIADNDGYRRITTSPARAPSPGPKPTGGGGTTGGGTTGTGGPSAFDEDLRVLLDELLADGAPPEDIDAILAAVPQGDATEDIVTAVPDAPPVPDDLASRALPPEEMA